MKQLKLIIYFLLQFILSITMFIGILLFILRITILSPNYIIAKIAKTNYYEAVYKSLQEEIPNYMIQSGLPKDILKDIYTKQTVKEEVDKFVKAFYKGQVEDIDTKDLEEKLSNNIDSYLEKNNIRITEKESIHIFIKQIADVYKTEIMQTDTTLKFQDFLPKIAFLVNIMIGVIIIISIVLILLIKLLLRRKIKCIPIFTISFLLFVSYFFVKESIDIKNIVLFTDYFSILIRSIIDSILNIMKNIAVISIIVSILLIVVSYLVKRKEQEIKITTTQ